MKIIVRDHERGVLFRDERPVEWLEPGRHRRYGWTSRLRVEHLDLDAGYASHTPELEALAPAEHAEVLQVPAQHVALIEVDGLPRAQLNPGTYLLWRIRHKVTAFVYDLRPLLLEVDRKHVAWLSDAGVRTIQVRPGTTALVYVDGQLIRALPAGPHILGGADQEVRVENVDLRLQERQIVGQEVMTKDKVSLRLNVIAQYQIVDAEKQAKQIPDLADALYTEVQLAARQLVASMTVDELLAGRDTARTQMIEEVSARTQTWGVEIRTIDLKDVILPGEMKALLNRVIEAEKQAAAQVILRREETAATRSMANTARMLEQNPMLLRLKELEAMKELAGHVGQLTVVTRLPETLERSFGGALLPQPAPTEK